MKRLTSADDEKWKFGIVYYRHLEYLDIIYYTSSWNCVRGENVLLCEKINNPSKRFSNETK
jgi:hypothetical protein